MKNFFLEGCYLGGVFASPEPTNHILPYGGDDGDDDDEYDE